MEVYVKPIPQWLRIIIRIDFLAAVVLTVLAPLTLLVRALLTKREQVGALLSYWRSSSLLMIAVYLLIGERPAGFLSGITARLLIPFTLWQQHSNDAWFNRWRQIVSGYCLLGALLNLPLLRCAIRPPAEDTSDTAQEPLGIFCRAYVEPAQEFAAVVHPGVPRETLAKVGDAGLVVFSMSMALAIKLLRYRKQPHDTPTPHDPSPPTS
jgi:hypothetical protein